MEKDINYYIDNIKNAIDIGEDTTSVYDFEDGNLLIDYKDSKFIAKPEAETIKDALIEKKKEGVNVITPLDIKRVNQETSNDCYILIKDPIYDSLSHFTYDFNGTKDQIKALKKLNDAPDEYFEKYISDMASLYNMIGQPTSKGIFFNPSKTNGGFIFGEFDNANKEGVCLNHMYEILDLDKKIRFINDLIAMPKTISDGTNKQLETANELVNDFKAKLFKAYEKGFPKFDKLRKWIIRSYSRDDLDNLKNHGINTNGLLLDKNEQHEFLVIVNQICLECLDMIKNKKHDYNYIRKNILPELIKKNELEVFWKYHPLNDNVFNSYTSLEEKEKINFDSIYDQVIYFLNKGLEKRSLSGLNSDFDKAYEDSLLYEKDILNDCKDEVIKLGLDSIANNKRLYNQVIKCDIPEYVKDNDLVDLYNHCIVRKHTSSIYQDENFKKEIDLDNLVKLIVKEFNKQLKDKASKSDNQSIIDAYQLIIPKVNKNNKQKRA